VHNLTYILDSMKP